MADLLYLMGFLSDEPPSLGSHTYDPEMLHVTFLNYASMPDSSVNCFIHSLEKVLRWHSPIPVRTEEDMLWFGEFSHIPVRTVQDEENLFSLLHHDTLNVLEAAGGKHISEHTSFSPHVSYAETSGHQGVVDHLSLIHHTGGFGVEVRTLHNFYLR